MSEENLSEIDTVDLEASATDGEALGSEIIDFDQNGLLLKIDTFQFRLKNRYLSVHFSLYKDVN